jgi:hypothetical protein
VLLHRSLTHHEDSLLGLPLVDHAKGSLGLVEREAMGRKPFKVDILRQDGPDDLVIFVDGEIPRADLISFRLS